MSSRKPCARCGKAQPPEKRQHSPHSGRYYCLDVAACTRRMKRLKRQGATFVRGFLEIAP